MMKWVVGKDCANMSVRDFLREKQSFSRRILKSIKTDGGNIYVNGMEQKINYRLQQGDTLAVRFPPEKKSSFMKPEPIQLNIIYEDEAILVINKRAGIATIPSVHHPSQTLANGILAYYERNNIPFTIHIVTRLDRETSGLVLVAKHRYSHSLLSTAQINGRIERYYDAIVEGNLEPSRGVIDAPIGRKEGSIIERTVREDGKRAITHYETIRHTDTLSLIRIRLETGRTHQIRVHFSAMGHPLLGDDLYGGSCDDFDRQALHCSTIRFVHPLTKKLMKFTAPLPGDMANLLSRV